eukprot:649031-Hanusia_phi.AAC.2
MQDRFGLQDKVNHLISPCSEPFFTLSTSPTLPACRSLSISNSLELRIGKRLLSFLDFDHRAAEMPATSQSGGVNGVCVDASRAYCPQRCEYDQFNVVSQSAGRWIERQGRGEGNEERMGRERESERERERER